MLSITSVRELKPVDARISVRPAFDPDLRLALSVRRAIPSVRSRDDAPATDLALLVGAVLTGPVFRNMLQESATAIHLCMARRTGLGCQGCSRIPSVHHKETILRKKLEPRSSLPR